MEVTKMNASHTDIPAGHRLDAGLQIPGPTATLDGETLCQRRLGDRGDDKRHQRGSVDDDPIIPP